ncbi:unnamed protein product, partial [Ixodes pacificus]
RIRTGSCATSCPTQIPTPCRRQIFMTASRPSSSRATAWREPTLPSRPERTPWSTKTEVGCIWTTRCSKLGWTNISTKSSKCMPTATFITQMRQDCYSSCSWPRRLHQKTTSVSALRRARSVSQSWCAQIWIAAQQAQVAGHWKIPNTAGLCCHAFASRDVRAKWE